MSKVDWSKAPEGAMYWRPTQRHWVRNVGTDWQFTDSNGNWIRFHPTMVPSQFGLIARPNLPDPAALLRNGPAIAELLRSLTDCDCKHGEHCIPWVNRDAILDLLRELGVDYEG